MAGYWSSSFFAQKKRGQYQAILTEQASSIKYLLYGFWGNFSCGTRRVVPSGQDGSILPARVANHSAGFDSSCPLSIGLHSHYTPARSLKTQLYFYD